jgi:hypothetical protein
MNNLLSKLVPFKKGESVTDNPEVTERLNALMEAVQALARGDNLATGGIVRKVAGGSGVVLTGEVPAALTIHPRPLPFQVSIVSAPSDSGGGPRARINGGWVYQSTSAHGSAKTTLEWIHIPTSVPPEDGGDGPWDTDLADGDNWIFLSNQLLGENPTSMDPPAATWTATEADTFKGVTLAYIFVDLAEGTAAVFQYHVGNVFVDNNFNLRSSGSLVGYHAELDPGQSETAMDLAFKLIAGADPIFTLFKGNDNGTYNAIKADYIGMMTDGTVGPEVALSRTSGRYLSLKPGYLESKDDAAAKSVVVEALSGPEVALSCTSGKYLSLKPAYIEAKNDAATRILTIEVDTEGKIYLLSTNPKLQLEGTSDWLEASPTYFMMGEGALGFGEKVVLNSNGTICLQLEPGSGTKLTYSPTTGLFIGISGGAWFQAVGGDLTGKDGDDKEYSLQEITYLDKDGNPKKVKGYFSAPEAAESGLSPRSVVVCVDNVRKSMNVLGSEPT